MKKIDEYKDIDLSTKNIPELILLVDELLNERDEINKNTRSVLDKLPNRNDTEIKLFLDTFKKLKKCSDQNRFTNGFEQAMKLKLILSSHKIFDPFFGDNEFGNLFRRIAKILVGGYFDMLESVENKLKLENYDLSIKLLNY
jgi:hypothetical protein